MDTIIYINNLEIVLLVLSLLLLFFLALKNIKSIKISIILTVFLMPPLYLSIEGTTQFLTVDEGYMIYEIIGTENSSLDSWYMSGYRTSVATIGTSLSLLKKYTYIGRTMNLIELKMFAKAVHWFLTFLIIAAIYYFIFRGRVGEKKPFLSPRK